MKFIRFLGFYAAYLITLVLLLALWGVIAALVGTAKEFILATVLSAVVCACAFIAFRYAVFLRRMKRIERLKREMNEVYLMGEMMPRPVNPLEEAYFTVMKEVSYSAVSRVESMRRESDEYLEFVESWVHEIKTPLTACSLILAGGGDVKKLKAELRRADNLAESVLYYARLRIAGTDMKVSRFSLREAAAEAVNNEMELLIAAGISADIEGDAEVSADRQALIFSVKQLLVNCAKYCRGGHVTITAADGMLTILDDGEGIPAHELPLIFRRSYVGSAGRRSGGGTGMGLYLVKSICEKCGINITADSEAGKYTRFTFVFGK